jgi:hypothetical protein
VIEDVPLRRQCWSVQSSLALLKLAVTRFFLISRCTLRAHAALQVIEELELSLQSIMGATENFQRKSLILLIYSVSSRVLYVIGPTEEFSTTTLPEIASHRII